MNPMETFKVLRPCKVAGKELFLGQILVRDRYDGKTWTPGRRTFVVNETTMDFLKTHGFVAKID